MLEITTTGAISGSASNLSFTMQRATPVVADQNEIYEKVQYLLRQAADIDSTSGVVTGRTADGDDYERALLDGMLVALSGRIHLDEASQATPEQILLEIWQEHLLLRHAAEPG